jgi:hypothetical protein
MDKRTVVLLMILVGMLVAGAGLFASKGGSATTEGQDQENQLALTQNVSKKNSAEKVEVYLFHTTKRCSTCIAIGRLAGETVNEYFQPELREGRIEFKEINMDLPENEALTNRFQASGSSLFINVIEGSKDNIAEDTTVWRLTDDEAGFKNYLKDKLNKLFDK